MTQHNALRLLLKQEGSFWLHHGLCVGVDYEAHLIARELGGKIHGYPPKDQYHMAPLLADCDILEKPEPFLVRDEKIVYNCEQLIAIPRRYSQELRSGTWATVRRAWKIGRPVMIIWPDGKCEDWSLS